MGFTFKNSRSCVSLFTLFIAVTLFPELAHGQSGEKAARQQMHEVLLLTEKAERDQYVVTQINFSGNIEIRDKDLRRMVNKFLSEGDIFSLENLVQGLRNLSRLKAIGSVGLADVEVTLHEKRTDIDLMITVREKRHSN